MSSEWVGVVISGASLLVSIASIWIQTWLTLRFNRSTGTPSGIPSVAPLPAPPVDAPPVTPPMHVPPADVPRSPGQTPRRHDLLPTALKNLTAATFVVPIVPLAYALFGLRVGTASFGIVSAAVIALLFTSAVVPLRVLVTARNQIAMRVTEVLCSVCGTVSAIGGVVFAYLTIAAILHVIGIEWPPGQFVNAGLVAIIGGLLAALSALAFYFLSSSAVLLKAAREAAVRS
jgi:hypothetical protein